MKHPEQDLNELETFLNEHRSNNYGMSIAEFDGFCSGLIVCPELIMPSEWLPLVLGDGETPEFKNRDDFQRAMPLIMGHYNRVARFLTPPCHTFETIYETDPSNGDVLWEPWLAGFCRAMDLRPKAWDKIISSGDEDLIVDLTMLLLMQAFCVGEVDLPDNEIDEMDEQAPDMIPNIVLDLNDWTKSRQQQGFPFASPTPANLETKPPAFGKVGRNALCPCGSGKKYKKCCG